MGGNEKECIEDCFHGAGILKKYLLASLYNSIVTTGNYYSALMPHDLARSR